MKLSHSSAVSGLRTGAPCSPACRPGLTAPAPESGLPFASGSIFSRPRARQNDEAELVLARDWMFTRKASRKESSDIVRQRSGGKGTSYTTIAKVGRLRCRDAAVQEYPGV